MPMPKNSLRRILVYHNRKIDYILIDAQENPVAAREVLFDILDKDWDYWSEHEEKYKPTADCEACTHAYHENNCCNTFCSCTKYINRAETVESINHLDEMGQLELARSGDNGAISFLLSRHEGVEDYKWYEDYVLDPIELLKERRVSSGKN